jgi:hypothetical protein
MGSSDDDLLGLIEDCLLTSFIRPTSTLFFPHFSPLLHPSSNSPSSNPLSYCWTGISSYTLLRLPDSPARTMPSHLSFLQAAIVLATLPSVIDATIGFDCSNVVHQKAKWNLKALEGPRAVHWIRPGTPSSSNFTFTLDICKPLLRHKGVPAADECAGGTNGEDIQTVWRCTCTSS